MGFSTLEAFDEFCKEHEIDIKSAEVPRSEELNGHLILECKSLFVYEDSSSPPETVKSFCLIEAREASGYMKLVARFKPFQKWSAPKPKKVKKAVKDVQDKIPNLMELLRKRKRN